MEVELNRGTLEGTAKSIADSDIDLGTVESAVANIKIPVTRIMLLERLFELLDIQGVLTWLQRRRNGKTHIFCGIPGLNGTQKVVRTRGKLEMEFEPKQAIDMLHEIEKSADLLFDLSHL